LFDVESARLEGAGHIVPDAAWHIAEHAHPNEWELVYFLKGSGRVELPGGSLSPREFQLVVYPPGLPHAEVSSSVDPEETIFMAINVPSVSTPSKAHIIADHSGEIGWLCERVFDETARHGLSGLAQAYTKALLYLIERAWETATPVHRDPVDRALRFIHANYSRSISLDAVARAACVSKTHLAHIFSKRLGISPLRYLKKVRIENARRLLVTTTIPIGEVAAHVGFSDALHFSRVMRTMTGLSPTELRRSSISATTSIPGTMASISDEEYGKV